MINFIRYKGLYFFLSILVLVPSLLALVFWGLKPAIDFTGGSLLELKISNDKLKIEITNSKLKEIVKKEGLELYSLQSSGENTYLFRMKPIDKNQNAQLQKALSAEFGAVEELRFETIGPTLGRELLRKTLVAVVLAAAGILLYVAWRFQNKKYGFCAVLAMFHDSLILLGAFSFLGKFWQVEVDALFVTAVLTILSASVHDTMVIYGKIRGLALSSPKASMNQIANQAINETIVRNLNNSLTIIFVLFSLFLLGGKTIQWFIFALLVGSIAGTYSSTFVAAPLLTLVFRRRSA